jgi:hypothetical protein
MQTVGAPDASGCLGCSKPTMRPSRSFLCPTGEPHLPFGGRAGSQSGLGRVGGRFSIERLTELKTIVVNLG